MSAQVIWDNEDKTIVRYIFQGHWGWDDFYSVTASDEDDVLGLHTVIGVDARIRSGGAFSAEIKWSWVEGDLWDEDMDFGGLAASLGYRFAF